MISVQFVSCRVHQWCKLPLYRQATSTGMVRANAMLCPTRCPDAHIHTPLKVSVWHKMLASHLSSQSFMGYISRGLTHGFQTGYQHGDSKLQQSHNIMPISNAPAVTEYNRTEVETGRLVEVPQEEATKLKVHCSPIGIIAKQSKPGKWHLIVDLSLPINASVSDGIEKELCSLSYKTRTTDACQACDGSAEYTSTKLFLSD